MKQSSSATVCNRIVARLAAVVMLGGAQVALAQTDARPEALDNTKTCVECHKHSSPGIYQQWAESKHHDSDIACYDCHQAEEGEPDAFKHEGSWIATIVSPADCAECHDEVAEEFAHSRHSKGGRILDSVDNVLAEVSGSPFCA